MITLMATHEGTEDQEFGPFLFVELIAGLLHCETEDGQTLDFYYNDDSWYPQAAEVVLVGDTLQYIDRGTPPPNMEWATVGRPDLDHPGWEKILIIEVENPEDDVSDQE